jgi:formylmethanofuran--tetrahydromethanopterin N-formyltransferase
MGNSFIEDGSFFEASEGICSRAYITAEDWETVRAAATGATATPNIVNGRTEGGIEKYVRKTPDKRPGAIVQFWNAAEANGKTFDQLMEKYETELSYRIRQDILVRPFTAVYDALSNPEGKMDMMEKIGHCGDGYEWVEKLHGKRVIIVPLMVPDFAIEKKIGYKHGVSGGNFWIKCKTKEAVKEAGKKALKAIHTVPEVVTPFGVCSAGSKPVEEHPKYPKIGPTTNHLYCPSLKKRLGKESKVQEGVNFLPEIVFNGTSLEAVKKAAAKGIEAVENVDGVLGVSAGNYGGELGKYSVYLEDLL